MKDHLVFFLPLDPNKEDIQVVTSNGLDVSRFFDIDGIEVSCAKPGLTQVTLTTTAAIGLYNEEEFMDIRPGVLQLRYNPLAGFPIDFEDELRELFKKWKFEFVASGFNLTTGVRDMEFEYQDVGDAIDIELAAKAPMVGAVLRDNAPLGEDDIAKKKKKKKRLEKKMKKEARTHEEGQAKEETSTEPAD